MHLILTKNHPNWKLPQRRVAKYMKRILKNRKDPNADAIDADIDEKSISTASSSRSTGSFFKRLRKSKKRGNSTIIKPVPQDMPTNLLPTREEENELPLIENVTPQDVIQEHDEPQAVIQENVNPQDVNEEHVNPQIVYEEHMKPKDAYEEDEDDDKIEKKKLCCEGSSCVMM